MKHIMSQPGRMHQQVLPIFFIGLLVFSLVLPQWAMAGPALDCKGSEEAYRLQGIPCRCINGQIVCDQPSSKSSSHSVNNAIKLQLFQGVLDAVMQGPENNAPSQQQLEAKRQYQLQRQQKERELEFERQKNFAEKKDKLLGILKGADKGKLADFKNLDGDAEAMSKAASDPFDKSSDTTGKAKVSTGTNFFGTTLSEPEITTLMESENDPIIVDLSKAKTFVAENLKQNEATIKKIEKQKEEGKQKTERQECKDSIAKYNRQVDDMKKFQKQTELTQSQLDEWRQKNDAAFWNAVIDGASFAVSEYFDYLKETRRGAENIKHNLDLIETKLIKEKVYTPAQIASLKTKLNLRMAEHTIVNYSSKFNNITEYFDYVKNVIQSSVAEIEKTDVDIKEFISNPKVKEYLNENPTTDAAQFLVGKYMTALLEKKGFTKYSYVSIAQLAVNTVYNATDMYLSYKIICTLRNALGKELEAARHIQSQISNTYSKIVECNK